MQQEWLRVQYLASGFSNIVTGGGAKDQALTFQLVHNLLYPPEL